MDHNRLPLSLRAYRKLSSAAIPLVGSIIRHRLKKGKEDPARIGERRGIAKVPRPEGPLIWIHGASVGEILAVGGLVGELRQRDFRILLTSGTATSAEVAQKRFSSEVIHQYIPYDAPRFVKRFLDHWRPDLALFIESDLWPNLILSCARQRLPMVLINGRMSPRSFPRWGRLSQTIGALLGRLDLCLAQSEVDASRFVALGGRDVRVTGNLKLDVEAPPADSIHLEELRAATTGRLVLVAASTHPGEEDLIAEAHQELASYFPSLLTVIVPRHPERGEEVEHLVSEAGLQVARRSLEQLPLATTDIYVADTMGEMGLFYRLAPVVFMGGSLVAHGGQNPIEAIKLGAAIVHGPHVFNFEGLYQALDQDGGASAAVDVETLVRTIGKLLADPDAGRASKAAAQDVVRQQAGALQRTLAELQPYLLQLQFEQGGRDA